MFSSLRSRSVVRGHETALRTDRGSHRFDASPEVSPLRGGMTRVARGAPARRDEPRIHAPPVCVWDPLRPAGPAE